MNFMETLIENVEKDVLALKDTPFSGLALAAREANYQVRDLLLEYIENIKAANEFKRRINGRLDAFLQNTEKQNSTENQAFFKDVQSRLWVILLIVSLATTVGILFLYLVGRRISKTVSLLTTGALALSRGDTDLAGMDSAAIEKVNARRDELGAIGRAFMDLVKYLKNKARALAKIADGDLDSQLAILSDKDELGNSLNSMVSILNDVLGQVASATRQVETGAAQISNSSQSLSEVTARQAAALEQITATTIEMSAMVKTNADKAEIASRLADESKNSTRAGNEQMGEMVQAMEKINASSKKYPGLSRPSTISLFKPIFWR